jgi:hypothetical protein
LPRGKQAERTASNASGGGCDGGSGHPVLPPHSHRPGDRCAGAGPAGRLFAALAAGITLIAGLGVRAVLSGWIAKYLGVALWATLVYFLILFLSPRSSLLRAFAICVIASFVVELAQLTPVPMELYRIHPFFALVFGTTFNLPDLPAYVFGAGIGVLTDKRRRKICLDRQVGLQTEEPRSHP